MMKQLNGLTHTSQSIRGKGVNKHNRMKAVANPNDGKRRKPQVEIHSRIFRQDGRNKKYKLERNVSGVSSIWIKRKQHL